MLRTFLTGHDMKHALESLVVLKNMGVRFTPTLKTAFRAFEECPWRDLKVVFLGLVSIFTQV